MRRLDETTKKDTIMRLFATVFLCMMLGDVNAAELKSNSVTKVEEVAVEQHHRTRRGTSGSLLTYSERVEFLDIHNQFRKDVNPTASNMQFMVWDEDLASMAQDWAEACDWNHGQPSRSSPPYGGTIGQNLYATTGSTVTGTSAVTPWKDEVADYTLSTNTCTNVCGHYTQVVWHDSTHLGCAIATCGTLTSSSLSGTTKYVVCNYGPAGNYVGVKPYTQGTTCTGCPGSTTCQNNICENSASKCYSKTCENGGTLDTTSCECDCPATYNGETCSTGGTGTDNDNGDDGNDGGGAGSLVPSTWLIISLIAMMTLRYTTK